MKRIIAQEPAVFVKERGKITAKLLHRPQRILEISNAAYNGHLTEQTDFICEGEEVILRNLNIPYLEKEWLHHENVPDFLNDAGREYYISDVLLMEPRQLFTFQFLFTYETEKPDFLQNVAVRNEALPQFCDKLKKGLCPKILVYGDSICNAANSSGEMNVSPYLAPWYELACEETQRQFGTGFTIINHSRSGYGSAWGAEHALENVTSTNADLLIVAFGMNDALEQLPEKVFEKNIQSILAARNPETMEYILVSTILPNRMNIAADYILPYRKLLAKLCGGSGALMDMTGVFERLLQKKRYCDISGNNFNHPNDYVYRMYAEKLQKLICV